MSKNFRLLWIVGIALGLSATSVHAQAWDTPSFMPPRPGDDIGIYFTDHGDFGISGIWRQHGNLNLGVRVGYIDSDVQGVDGTILVGGETWAPLFSAGPDFPVDVSWTLGAGATFNDFATSFAIPGGVTVGRAFVLTPLTVQVYGHPRLVLAFVSANNDVEADLDGVFDLGADVEINEAWKLRLGASLGGVDALGVGFAYRFGRGVEVR